MSDTPQIGLPDEQCAPVARPKETINTASPIDEASLESFPASDPPGWTGGNADSAHHAVGASDYEGMGDDEAPSGPRSSASSDKEEAELGHS